MDVAADANKSLVDESDVRAIVRLVSHAARADGGLPGQKRRLVEGLADLIGADRFMWNVTRFDPDGIAALSLLHNWSEAEFAAISEWSYQTPDNDFNRAVGQLISEQPGLPWTRTMEQVTSADWWQQQCALSEAARRMRSSTQLFCCHPIPSHPDTLSMLGLHRDEGRETWTAREARIAHIVFTEVAWLHADDAVPAEDGSGITPLPPRLQTVLTLLIDGRVPKEIAQSLSLSVHTVRTYIRDLYAHFDVSGRPELLRRFMTGDGGDRPEA